MHDLWRNDDCYDLEHGRRAAARLPQLHRSVLSFLTEEQLQLLVKACEIHSDGVASDNATINACLDADRLDLWRVGLDPDPHKMCSPKGKKLAAQGWGSGRKR